MSVNDDLEPELVVDCWDQLDEKVIDSQLNKLTKNISKINTSPSTQDNEESSSSAILTMYDQEFRPQIIQRPVTILRRTEPSQANDGNDKKATKAFKTYEQRQQEYAEARLRILGAAKNPEEETSSDDGKNILKGSTTTSIDSGTKQMNGTINGHSNNRITANQTASSSNKNISNQPTRPDNAVTRQPIGPDGSTGFSFRR